MDVQNPSAYPVFDARRGAGTGGEFTFPDQARNPYGRDAARNEWTVDRPGTLILTAGHLHPGGLHDDLSLVRSGATIAKPPTTCSLVAALNQPARRRATARRRRRGSAHGRHRATTRSRHKARTRGHHQRSGPTRRAQTRGRPAAKVLRCTTPPAPIPGPVPHSVALFRSNALYYDPNGPVSWDLSMTATPSDWRVGVRKGDKLRISVTTDTTRASWYEGMGIMLAWMADEPGPDPFRTAVDQQGQPTHGHLPENGHYGGIRPALPDPLALTGAAAPANTVAIANFNYTPGDLTFASPLGDPPVIHTGQSLTFVNLDAGRLVHHTVTSCREPCNREAGVSYPIANGQTQFDSGQLGYGPPLLTAAANRVTWSTPRSLAPGTYAFFCRIHPFMRGSFRVVR
jgi:hypothetical protein